MKRNSIFDSIPLLKPKRNTFNLSFENKLSTDLFRLTPSMVKEALPDDVVTIRPEIFCRVSPLLAPIFHRLNIRTYFFFVPTRIIWDDFEKWINPKSGVTDIVAPRIHVDNTDKKLLLNGLAFAPKSLADYLGVNFGVSPSDASTAASFAGTLAEIFTADGFTISSLPFRAYQQIYNDWFIDLNNVDVAEFSKDSGVEEFDIENDTEIDDNEIFHNLLKIRYKAWEHDYFTSALPEPQRGPDVNAFDGGTGEGGSISGIEITGSGIVNGDIHSITTNLPVIPLEYELTTDSGATFTQVGGEWLAQVFYSQLGFQSAAAALDAYRAKKITIQPGSIDPDADSVVGIYAQVNTNGLITQKALPLADSGQSTYVRLRPQYTTSRTSQFESLGQIGLLGSDIADALSVSGSGEGGTFNIPAVTVEELRIRMQMQSFLERNEVGGSRYTEMLYAHWGVKDPDGRLQRSEFLGGCKQPIVISDISSTVNEDDEPLGMYAGQGHSSSAGRTIRYRVPEHGYIIGITTIVPRSGYSQGLHPMWRRFDRLDYYWPSFSHLGEQEVKNSELMFTGFDPDGTFGYQMRYAELKTSLDEVHGDMKGNLSHWHMSRMFATPESEDDLPKLSEAFTTPQDSNSDDLERVWPVAGSAFEALNADHFVLDIYMHFYASRRMPKFVTPRNGS